MTFFKKILAWFTHRSASIELVEAVRRIIIVNEKGEMYMPTHDDMWTLDAILKEYDASTSKLLHNETLVLEQKRLKNRLQYLKEVGFVLGEIDEAGYHNRGYKVTVASNLSVPEAHPANADNYGSPV